MSRCVTIFVLTDEYFIVYSYTRRGGYYPHASNSNIHFDYIRNGRHNHIFNEMFVCVIDGRILSAPTSCHINYRLTEKSLQNSKNRPAIEIIGRLYCLPGLKISLWSNDKTQFRLILFIKNQCQIIIYFFCFSCLVIPHFLV